MKSVKINLRVRVTNTVCATSAEKNLLVDEFSLYDTAFILFAPKTTVIPLAVVFLYNNG